MAHNAMQNQGGAVSALFLIFRSMLFPCSRKECFVSRRQNNMHVCSVHGCFICFSLFTSLFIFSLPRWKAKPHEKTATFKIQRPSTQAHGREPTLRPSTHQFGNPLESPSGSPKQAKNTRSVSWLFVLLSITCALSFFWGGHTGCHFER